MRPTKFPQRSDAGVLQLPGMVTGGAEERQACLQHDGKHWMKD